MAGAGVHQRARGDDSWPAWNCDKARLLRVAERLDSCFAAPRAAVAAQPQPEDPKAVAAQRLDVQMLARHNDLKTETQGEPSAVLSSLDSVGLESIALTAGTHPGMLMLPSRMVDVEFYALHEQYPGMPIWFAGVTLNKKFGASLHVNGTDPTWVRSTFNEMKNELEKGVPWWSRLRNGRMWVAYFFLSLVASGLATYPWLGDDLWVWGGVSAGAGLALGTLLYVLARRLLPGFELLAPGQTGRGLGLLTLCGAAVGQLVIGVIVNLLTQK
jgi:hypothetical protein